MNIKTIIGIVIIAILAIWGVSSYNGLVNKQEKVNQAWSQVENQYQRRSDLIPNLVQTVKGAANFEKSTLTQVIQARSKASSIQINAKDLNNPQKLQQFQQAQQQLSGALSHLMVTVERYPKLTATQNFQDLQNQLEGSENRISVARRRFNQAAQQYNTDIRHFPTNIFAGIFGFHKKAYFKAEKGAQNAPKVQF
ncbi:MAG TPA: LemA family protein [Balneolaceae bacterium]|nr:LemA family protein [Balneolaceae bacterium]